MQMDARLAPGQAIATKPNSVSSHAPSMSGYTASVGAPGALPRSSAGHDDGDNDDDDETHPLLCRRRRSSKGRSPWRTSRLRRRMTAEVSRSWADVVLLLCYVVTGLLDSASTQVWGVFVSMQTGNTVFVGLGLASLIYPPTSPRLYKSGLSLLCFCVGSFFFARFHRLFSPKRRWVLCASFTVQALLIITAALIVTLTPPAANQDAHDWTVLLPIALVALTSCGQAVTSRALKYNALTSVVLTSIYCDLFSDQDLFALHNEERNRRASAPILLLLGAVAGGVISHTSIGIAGALWIASFLKFLMAITWFYWPAEPSDNDNDQA